MQTFEGIRNVSNGIKKNQPPASEKKMSFLVLYIENLGSGQTISIQSHKINDFDFCFVTSVLLKSRILEQSSQGLISKQYIF